MTAETSTQAQPPLAGNGSPLSLKPTTTALVVQAHSTPPRTSAELPNPAPKQSLAPEAIASSSNDALENNLDVTPTATIYSVTGSSVEDQLHGPVVVQSADMASSGAQCTKSTKSKKKKNAPVVTMATAVSAISGGPGTAGENTGRWTAEEHRLFLQGLEQHGKGWKKIASLIKSRTVVQIRTHAQKYFQKLAKARQNGEEGEISMEGRGGPSSVTSGGMPGGGTPTGKRRRQTTGTKRKAIASVVASATREGKKMATGQGVGGVPSQIPPLPAVAPALAPFVAHTHSGPNHAIPSSTGSHSALVSGPALEDSLFRFLTPPPVQNDGVQLNEVARQAGANPITLPSENLPMMSQASGGDVSPTGVMDVPIFPTWSDVKDMPSWYAKGADIDCLLDVADTLDWLTDSGDLHESYMPPAQSSQSMAEDSDDLSMLKPPSSLTVDQLDESEADGVPSLPCLFEGDATKKPRLSSTNFVESESIDQFDVFDTPMEEHAFVSALLDNGGESAISLAGLGEVK